MGERKGFNRREFLKIVGAGAGAAATGCGRDLPEKLIPYVVQPDEIIPGVAAWYAGSCFECDAGCGLLVRTLGGRALKVEGHPEHPVNKGGLCARGQSLVQGLYDPDRVREPLLREANGVFKPISWEDALAKAAEAMRPAAEMEKENVLLTKPLSMSEASLSSDFIAQLTNTSHVEYDTFSDDVFDQAAEIVFGPGAVVEYDFSTADVVFGLGADYLETWRSPVEYTKGFSKNRSPKSDLQMSRVFHVEPRMSLTAANADYWIKNSPGSEHKILLALLREVVISETRGKGLDSPAWNEVFRFTTKVDSKSLLEGTGMSLEQCQEAAKRLTSAANPLVVVGGASLRGPNHLQAAVLGNLLNAALGNVGKTLIVRRKKQASRVKAAFPTLKKLLAKLKGAKVGVLTVAYLNPAYSLPPSLDFKKAAASADFMVYMGTHLDETARMSNLVLPLSTSLESWRDQEVRPRAYNLNQPSMQALYSTKSYGDVLLSLLAREEMEKRAALPETFKGISSFYDYMRRGWKDILGSVGFEKKWNEAVRTGGYWKDGSGEIESRDRHKIADNFSGLPDVESEPQGSDSDVVRFLLAFPTVRSQAGETANRSWLQEVPDPLTTSVWGSWLEMHPESAKKLGLSDGQLVDVQTSEGAVKVPLYLTKRIHPQLVAMPLGQGHQSMGRYAVDVGVNPLSILPPEGSQGELNLLIGGVKIKGAVAQRELVKTQGHDSQLGRGIIRSVSLVELGQMRHKYEEMDHSKHKDKDSEHSGGNHDPHALGPQPEPKQMYKQAPHAKHRWGMSVDISRCTGCSACVVACYAENNIAVVGKELCEEGREMSWIQVQRFIDDESEQPVNGFMPSMCQQCSNAPCEPVCPVYATYHGDEGLNTMVYNRCVGTRYCSNNCSYKARRFNWFNYSWPEPLNWQLNPDVTVREIGVMEKCTFCVQRIRGVEHLAKDQGRDVRDGEIQPACASSCPADAIVFGDLLDEHSKVHDESLNPRSYRVFNTELNTQPAVYYQAKVNHEK